MKSNPYSRASKEDEKLTLFYGSLLNRFYQAMFSVDHDDPKTPDIKLFEMFNRSWVTFATNWNKKAKRTYADPDLFYNYSMDAHLTNDESDITIRRDLL